MPDSHTTPSFAQDVSAVRRKIELNSDHQRSPNIDALDRIVASRTKLMAACEHLIRDYEASGGECYCDNVTCAYHLAKEAAQ